MASGWCDGRVTASYRHEICLCRNAETAANGKRGACYGAGSGCAGWRGCKLIGGVESTQGQQASARVTTQSQSR
jgi:hypothetical protein